MAEQGRDDPIPNLADPAFKHQRERHVLFVLPGTDIEVSLSRVDDKEVMVYFRRTPDQFPNLGFINVNMRNMMANYSVDEVDLKKKAARS